MFNTKKILDYSVSRWKRGFWSRIVCLLFLVLAVNEIFEIQQWKELRTLHHDNEAYYHYLPATFIHGDLLDLSYVSEIDARIHKNRVQTQYGIVRIEETGHDCLKYTYGVALFETPLFLLAHGYCSWFGTAHKADGYSAPYQLAVSLSSVLFALLGLLVLRRFMLRYVSDKAVALALLTISLGTNLFCYSTVDSGMSHAYLFFLFAVILSSTAAWHRKPTHKSALVLGIALGLTLLTRPVDILVVFIPLLWTNGAGWRTKWSLVSEDKWHLVLATVSALIVLLPQMLYWKATTDHFIHYSYGSEGFNWTDPHVWDGLFSFRKGWLVYSPLVGFGIIGSVFMLFKKDMRHLIIPAFVFFVPFLYVIFCWHMWWYGGGFGARALVESLALLALPMAIIAEVVLDKNVLIKSFFGVMLMSGIFLNFFQQKQYDETIIHWDKMTQERYWEVWGKDSQEELSPFP